MNAWQYQSDLPGNHTADHLSYLRAADKLARARDFPAALKTYRHALSLDRQSVDAHAGIAYLFLDFRMPEQSLRWFERALAIDEQRARVRAGYSAALLRSGLTHQAVTEAERSYTQEPASPYSCCCLAEAVYIDGLFDRSRELFETALRLEPSYPSAVFGLAQLSLLFGDYRHGWKLYDQRFPVVCHTASSLSLPFWTGENSPQASLLVHGEQGIGDSIHFSRFITLARERVRHLVLEVPACLHKLFARLDGVDQLIAPGESHNADRQVPLMSLPSVLGITSESCFRSDPYLQVDRPPYALPSYRTGPEHCFNIGIAWAGNPKMFLDRIRSLPLSIFAPLASAPDVSLRSLQRGDPALGELDTFSASGFYLTHDPVAIDDLTVCAAIRDMDLIITVDTSIAHCAGALGAPVWVLLSDVPDWRWQLGRADSPWYRSMRLFRQPSAGDWTGAMAEVMRALPRYRDEVSLRSRQNATFS